MKKLLSFHIVLSTIFGCAIASPLFAATAVVPTDYATVQDAVTAVESDAEPGEVIVNSNDAFDESVLIQESVTLRAGTGFSPVIERTSGWSAPIQIRATQDSDTAAVLRGITVRTQASGNFDGITISNVSSSNTLNVTIENVTVDAKESQSAISVASATINADISVILINNFIQIEGAPAGSPECLRLDPYAYNLTAVLRNNTFRFSRAGGVSIQGGRDDVLVTTTIDANVFEGFVSVTGTGRQGVHIHGTGTAESDESATQTTITNNLFLRASSGADINGQLLHTHTVFINNNTIVGSSFDGLDFRAFGTSTIEASAANNIVVGSAGFGILRQESLGCVVNLANDFNLLFDNVAGNYSGITAGANSLAMDPMFTNPGGDNYRLQPRSPAVDSGTNTPPGGLGFGEDLDGNARVQDNDGDGNAECNMGAYEVPAASPTPLLIGGGGDGGLCFIATAAYGSRMAKEVRVFEKVRDEYLLTNELGRTFVSAYYRYSPRLADRIAKHPVMRKIVRIGLYPILGLSKWFVGEKPSE